MPDSCNLANFSGVLEIAFGLSAILYYLDLRHVIRTKIAELAKEFEKFVLGAEREGIRMALKDHPEEIKELLYKRYAEQENVIRRLLLAVPGWTELLLQSMAIGSSLLSLGALLYSGFYPTEDVDCVTVALLLTLCYFSIGYNLLYFTSLPLARYVLKVLKRRIGIQ